MLKIAPHIVLFIIIPIISFISTDAFSESISLNDTASSLENLNATNIPIINGTSDGLITPFAQGCGLILNSGAEISFGEWNKTDITGIETTEFRNKGRTIAMLTAIATPWFDDEGNNIMPANATSFTVTDKKSNVVVVPPTLLSTQLMNLTNITIKFPLLFEQTVTVTPFENATNFGGDITQIITFGNVC